MEAEDRHAAAGFQGAGQEGEELVQHAELVVHGDAQGLEAALEGLPGLRIVPVEARLHEGAPHDFREVAGAEDGLPRGAELLGDLPGEGFLCRGGETVIQGPLGQAPPVGDGAGLAWIGAEGLGDRPRARVLAYAESGGDPAASLTAGFAALDKALARAGHSLEDMDRIEFMEAFAVTIARFMRDRSPDPDKVNVSGGHLAKGHPMGATGAILTSTLLDALEACRGRLGLVVATGAMGVGAAIVVERI